MKPATKKTSEDPEILGPDTEGSSASSSHDIEQGIKKKSLTERITGLASASASGDSNNNNSFFTKWKQRNRNHRTKARRNKKSTDPRHRNHSSTIKDTADITTTTTTGAAADHEVPVFFDYHQPSTDKTNKPIRFLRFAVVATWLAAALGVSYGVFSYTKNAERKEFEIQYRVDAEKILDTFHATIDKRLVATNTLATAMTMHAKSTNQSFPFVTMPDYVVAGSNARILADSAVIHWLPLITDDTREEWEDYAYKNRHQVDEEFAKDEEFRRLEDIRLGYTNPPENNRRSLVEEDEELLDLDPGHVTYTPDNLTIVDNIVQDGTRYQFRIYSKEMQKPAPDGAGPFLPIWQRSPVSAAKQGTINTDMASSRGLSGIFPYWSKKDRPKGALLMPAIIPHPNIAPLHDKVLFASQYRHQAGPYQGTPTTKLAYPVFDGFGQDAKFVGVLATTIYWRLSFLQIFKRLGAQGMICVIENSYDQIFSYRIDGSNVTYLGEGDPLLNKNNTDNDFIFEDMMETLKTTTLAGQEQQSSSQRPIEERRSFTTMPLDLDFGEYRLKIYPTKDTYKIYQGSEPVVHTLLVASIFVLAAIVFLLYDFYVQKRHKTMLAEGIDQAHRVAVAERELNEYLAHEVRNPLSAAMSACSFVSSAVKEATPLANDESRQAVRDDVRIINSSLQFINDLLRNMLDLHRAVNHQVAIQKKATDLYHDVLEPVASMLYCRDHSFEVLLDCPQNLIVETDSLRLRQIILNLGRNAAKFVETGFVRLRAEVFLTIENETTTITNEENSGNNDNCTTGNKSASSSSVRIYVEDSGPGIPMEKRKTLFAKFQQSLDVLSQGTGVGLCLCKQLTGIMDGDLWLDESFDSGVEGCPGTRFVVDLKTEPCGSALHDQHHDYGSGNGFGNSTQIIADGQHCSTPADSSQVIEIESGEEEVGKVCIILEPTSTSQEQQQPETNHALPNLAIECEGMPAELASDTGQAINSLDTVQVQDQQEETLPETLSVLFVDDDMVLRKLFVRSIKRLVPSWRVKEASSGETAIRLVDTEHFDLIFMDQYMASTEKQLLGTEATRELRAKGVTSKICGLSANDKKAAFLGAGADNFMLKPVPCDKSELKRSLLALLRPADN